MEIEPRNIVERFIATFSTEFTVVHADLDAGVVTFDFKGLDNTVYLPAAVLAAAVTEVQSLDAESRLEYFTERQICEDGRPLIEVLGDEIAWQLELAVLETSNPARVWTYYDDCFEPVTPVGLAEYLAVPPLTALTLSGERLVGMTSTGLREVVLLEELDLDAELTRGLRQWLSDAADLSNVTRSDRQARWSVLAVHGAALADQVQLAVGPDVVVGYVHREPLNEARPSDSPAELGPTNGSAGFWTTGQLNDQLEES